MSSVAGPSSRPVRRRLWGLGLLVTVALGLGLPGTYYGFESRRLHQLARSHAQRLAADVAASRPLDLEEVLRREPELLGVAVLDVRGSPLVAAEGAGVGRWWNANAPRAHAVVTPTPGGPHTVDVVMRRDHVVKTTAVFLALASLLGGLLAVLLYAVPMAVITRMERRNRRLEAERETLAMIGRELTAELDLDRLLRLIIDHASALFSGNGAIYLLDAHDKLVPRAWTAGGAFGGVHIAVGQGLVGTSAKLRQALCIDDYPTSPYALPEFVAIGLRSAITQPLLIHEQLLGVIAMNRLGERVQPFSSDDMERLRGFAAQAAIALENARLFAENRRQVESLSVLHELSRTVTGQLERGALVDAIAREAGRVSGVAELVVLLTSGDEELTLARHGPAGRASMDADTARKLGVMVLQAARAVRIDGALVGGDHARAWLGVPMTGGNAEQGALLVALEGAMTEAQEHLLTDIGQLAGLALGSARLFEERGRAYADLATAQDTLLQAEKLRALGEMASGVAHDFNNLLAAITGRTQLLLGRVQDPVLRRWVEAIKRAADDGAQTVRRLQEFTRIRRDQPFAAVDLNEVLRGALEVTETRWRHDAQARGVVITVETELGALPPIAGDAVELREVMINLILNAVDAMPAGGRLRLVTTADDTEVEARIADTGVGMTEEVRQKLFDPFFTTKGPKGTGLGLSITYGIVSRHGGRVLVESEPGCGATFRLRFPRRSDLGETAVAAAEPAPRSARTLRCLVVDDDEAVASALADLLASDGHEATVVSHGAEALRLVGRQPPDIVFSDLAMPDMSGWELARAVKATAPALPVVLITGLGVELSPEQCRASHVDAVLAKPVELGALMAVATRLTQ